MTHWPDEKSTKEAENFESLLDLYMIPRKWKFIEDLFGAMSKVTSWVSELAQQFYVNAFNIISPVVGSRKGLHVYDEKVNNIVKGWTNPALTDRGSLIIWWSSSPLINLACVDAS